MIITNERRNLVTNKICERDLSCIIALDFKSKPFSGLVLWSGHAVLYYFVKGPGFNFKPHERERGGGRDMGENRRGGGNRKMKVEEGKECRREERNKGKKS